jgi:predicted AlkP superfamily phosphohydrolase/phosphomutase/tetratricopeptide (TPR) repeat protein
MLAQSGKRKILLIGWDAADWRVINPLLEAGKMPALESLINRGIMGNLATIRPMLSPMLWTSIATGKRAYKHGIHGFAEPRPDGDGIQPISNLSRKAKAFWNIFHQSGMCGHVVGWWPSNPAEPIRGSMVSNLFQTTASIDPTQPWPVSRGAVHPQRLIPSLADLRFHPTELVDQQIRPFIPHAEEVDQDQDSRMGICAKMLAECTTVHAVATFLSQNEPWDYMAVYYDAIDHFCHGYMKYHPPRQPHISERDFRLYSNVVEAAYRLHDMMLATWLSYVGPDTTIVLLSDHGFHPDHLRLEMIPSEPAAPAAEHRELGIFVMAGPGIKQDERIYGASVLDVCPTLLVAAGLPIADDMDGAPLLQAWESPPAVETIESWECVPGDAGQHPPDLLLDPRESQQAIEQLVELGYIERPDEDARVAVQKTVRELRFNLAQSYMDGDRHADATEILEELQREAPDDNRIPLKLVLCYRALDQIGKLGPLIQQMKDSRIQSAKTAVRDLIELATQVAERPIPDRDDSPPTDMMQVPDIDLCEIARLLASPQLNPERTSGEPNGAKSPPRSRLLLRDVLHRATDGEKQQIRVLVNEAQYNPYSFDYLEGYVQLAEGDVDSALASFQRAEQLEPRRPWLPIQIGEAYLQVDAWEDAERSFHRALEIDNENAYAYAGLARSYLGRRMNRKAAEAALAAVGILHHFALAHYLLGIALHRLGKNERAIQALELAVSINPNFAEAHRRLAQIQERLQKDPEKAAWHRALAREKFAQVRGQNPPVLPKAIPGIAAADRTSRHLERVRSPIPNRLALQPKLDISDTVTIVTGLPRSGTSMMMQMLAAGGIPALSDGQRAPDKSNPRGYFEFEPVKRLKQDSSWIPSARGRAVKIIAQLLPHLPRGNFRVIFMERDLREVVDSQKQMLARNGSVDATLGDGQLMKVYATQLAMVGKLLHNSALPVLRVDYRQCVENPASVAGDIHRFLGGKLCLDSMTRAVDQSLYRQRSEMGLGEATQTAMQSTGHEN